MIDSNTPDRIGELGQQVAAASAELTAIFTELSCEADSQLALAAAAFVQVHGAGTNPAAQRLRADYRTARQALLAASVAAANIHEMAERANTLAHKCVWWKTGATGRGQMAGDITRVCDQVKPTA